MSKHKSALTVAGPDAQGDYFDYSIDELGLQDLKAADEVINQLALQELGYAATHAAPHVHA